MRFGLLGRKLGHSYSPAIFDLLGHYRYDLFEREPEQLEAFLKEQDFSGLNVTIPYKKAVLPLLDEVDPLARRLGSVNTIVKRPDGRLEGYNSDYDGFSYLVRRSGLDLQGKKALVLGSGGASVTVAAVLQDQRACVVIISRHGENHYQNLHLHRDARIIVNTTPVGMFPDTGKAALDVRLFPHLEGVFDLIYNPARTRLLLDCERCGIPAWNGLGMLVAQAKTSAEHFLGRSLPDSIIEEIHGRLRQQMENIVLIGMPGCGKSAVGALLAAQTGKTFVDADVKFTETFGRSPASVLETEGEAIFRQMETQVLQELGKGSRQVIATGGGCVTRSENLPLLHQNGTIIWLRRSLDALSTRGRPLSQKTSPALLYQQREPLYRHFCDAAADNDGTPEEAVQAILNRLEELS